MHYAQKTCEKAALTNFHGEHIAQAVRAECMQLVPEARDGAKGQRARQWQTTAHTTKKGITNDKQPWHKWRKVSCQLVQSLTSPVIAMGTYETVRKRRKIVRVDPPQLPSEACREADEGADHPGS